MWLELAVAGNAPGMNLWVILLHSHPISKIVFVLLIGCSILSIAVIIERWIVLNRARLTTLKSLESLDTWTMARQWDTARDEIAHATRASNPLFSVLRAGIAYWQELVDSGETRLDVMESMVKEAVTRELKLVRSMLRANLPVLANIASVAPFIGLFGTVVGIILTFDIIAKKGNMGQDLVAGGIADALVATAMGLFAAIPAVIAYNFLTDRVNQVVLEMEAVAMERIYYLVQREGMSLSELPQSAPAPAVKTPAYAKE
ncbi:MAG: MotA/TolQ/ExbB proton channel family protein [Armatimonadota bacterium]